MKTGQNIREKERTKVDMKKVTSIILGGGAGTRLNPLTLHRAKPAVSISNHPTTLEKRC